MERRNLLSAAAAGLAAPAIAHAQPRLNWRCAGSFPKSLDTLHGNQEFICRRVSELTDGNFQIRSFAPGEIVPRCRCWTPPAPAPSRSATPRPTRAVDVQREAMIAAARWIVAA
jgi:hypothetical protein